MKRIRFAVVPLAVFLAAPMLAAPPQKTAPPGKVWQRYNAALAAVHAGDTLRAATLCREALKLSPNAAPVWATLARLLSEQGHNADALVASRKAVALEPKAAPFVADLSDFLLRSGKTGEAEAVALRALTLDPENDAALSVAVTCRLAAHRDAAAIPLLVRLQAVRGGKDRAVAENLVAAHLRVGDKTAALTAAQAFANQKNADADATLAVVDLALQIGNAPVAEKYITRLANVAPKSPLPAYYRARLALADTEKPLAVRLTLAEASYQNAANLLPQEALFRTELGIVQVTQAGALTGTAQAAKLSAARANLTAAALYDSHNPRARRGLAVVAETEKNWDDAVAQYDALLRITPNDDAARRRYAGVLLSAGRKAEGYAQFYELANRLPQNTLYLKELASFYLDDKEYARARAVYGQVLERTPGDADALVGMGQAYADDAKLSQARNAYDAAIAAAPRREAPYLLLAQLYINDGETDAEAIQTLERLLAVRPDSQNGRALLIERYIKAKRDDDARREIGKLTLQKGDPNRNRFRLALGNLFMVREKWADAVTEFERIALEEPENPLVLAALAGAYTKAGRAADANATYEKAATTAETALQKNSADADARAALVQARTAQNRPDAATAFFKTLDAARNGG